MDDEPCNSTACKLWIIENCNSNMSNSEICRLCRQEGVWHDWKISGNSKSNIDALTNFITNHLEN